MVGAASTHLSNGFFMNWFGTLPAGVEGFEYHLLALSAIVAVKGSGALSLDAWLARRAEPEAPDTPRVSGAREA